MGNYNPHAPYILGEEWTPIRQEDYLPDQVTEIGYTFVLPSDASVVSGGIVVAELPQSYTSLHCDPVFVYPAGLEEETGPIQMVTIPVTAVTVSGGAAATVTNLLNPSDLSFAICPADGVIQAAFDVASYTQALLGKRIVDVTVAYTAYGPLDALQATFLGVTDIARDPSLPGLTYAEGLPGDDSFSTAQVRRISMGYMNRFAPNAGNPSAFNIVPWRYQELLEFIASDTRRIQIEVPVTFTGLSVTSIGYLALEVKYCEERRVAYGAVETRQDNLLPTNKYHTGLTIVQLRDPVTLGFVASLPAGAYTAVVTHNQVNAVGLGIGPGLGIVPTFAQGTGPKLAALRQYFELPSHQGLRVNQTTKLGDTFTKETSQILPPITLFTASTPVTGTHPYGAQVAAPVYGSITATQRIEGNPLPATRDFHQVRYYARRFGDTAASLLLTGPASIASITPSEFDELPEILDGWKEVSLRLSVAQSFTAGATQDWVWSASGEPAGSRWEVLGADAATGAGVYQTGPVTYPDWQTDGTNGQSVAATWKAPNATGSAYDPSADLVLFLATDPPTVTGFGVSLQVQSVSGGLGTDCGIAPDCIPTGIYYHQVIWSPVSQASIPASGFGYYELQRMDTVDPDWQTVMQASGITVTGFADYEARVGVQSSYRIRACNTLEFCGSWSSTVVGTISAPGIVGGGGGNGTLVFTSNVGPTGNLAHTMAWAGDVQEEFGFPESETVQLQRMYNRDFRVAFHSTERGGERFQRVLLVQAAAVALPSLGNFRSLRDLAWASLPYVCVRDELGNRWYATVIVPGGNVRRNRRLYLASVDIEETTDTPFPVDPT